MPSSLHYINLLLQDLRAIVDARASSRVASLLPIVERMAAVEGGREERERESELPPRGRVRKRA